MAKLDEKSPIKKIQLQVQLISDPLEIITCTRLFDPFFFSLFLIKYFFKFESLKKQVLATKQK